MISAKPTEHLTGVLIEGEYEDFYEMVWTSTLIISEIRQCCTYVIAGSFFWL